MFAPLEFKWRERADTAIFSCPLGQYSFSLSHRHRTNELPLKLIFAGQLAQMSFEFNGRLELFRRSNDSDHLTRFVYELAFLDLKITVECFAQAIQCSALVSACLMENSTSRMSYMN